MIHWTREDLLQMIAAHQIFNIEEICQKFLVSRRTLLRHVPELRTIHISEKYRLGESIHKLRCLGRQSYREISVLLGFSTGTIHAHHQKYIVEVVWKQDKSLPPSDD